MEQVISGTIPIATLPDTSDIAGGYFGLLQGIFYVVKGDIDKGRTVIKTIMEKPAFEAFPQSLRILCLGIFMIPIVYEQDSIEIETLSERIRLETVQGHNLFHHAFLSLLWGITALNSNKPYRALLYSREAIEKSRSSGGPVIEFIAGLLLGEALTDLNETDDAKSHLNSWQEIWERSGLHMFATAGALELVNIALREGRTNDARRYYENAVRLYPDCEHFRHILRPPGFVDRINRSMCMKEDDPTVWWPSADKIIRIRTFGALQLQIGDHTFSDHEWRSWRTKMLLKSLIVYGGVKVPTFKIAMLLWPDAEGDRAIGNLKVALFRLRQLGVSNRICIPAWVHLQHGRLSLSHWLCSVDSLAFDKSFTRVMKEGGTEELIRLLDLYADDFLKNDTTEIWVIQRRQELQEMFFKAVGRFVNIALESGEEESALSYIQKAIEKDPLRESLYGCRMKLFLSMGYPAEVLETYKLACHNLKSGLGISPGPALIALARKAGHSH